MRWIEPPAASVTIFPGFHPILAQALSRRGINSLEAARAFLDPDEYRPCHAKELPGLYKAVERLTHAIRNHESICVWGDFDVDGQTSTTLLVQTLQALGANVIHHIPVRQQESHGIGIPRLHEIIDRGVQVILTCDTGITALAAVEVAQARGVDIIITDHHDLPPILPNAIAVVNPKLLSEDHPLASISGVGVAFKLAEALLEQTPDKLQPAELLDLVALGLVADVAILKRDARYLVQKGLVALRNTSRLGLKALMQLAELSQESLTEEHIGFTIAPRLNALGRLGDANPIVEFLTTSNPARARTLASQLENYNAQRQLLCEQVTQAAEAQLLADPSLLTTPILLVGHPSWPGGIIGIVAARLVQRYGKPAIVFTTPPGEPVRGSARSVEGFNITEAIAYEGNLLTNFGGHPMAAGLSLDPENYPAFQKSLLKRAEKIFGEKHWDEHALEIGARMTLPELTLELAREMEPLAPFGPGNPRLVFSSHNLTLKKHVKVGRNKEHLKLTIEDKDGNTAQVLWWDAGEPDLPTVPFDLAYTLRCVDWRGNQQIQLEYVDLQPIETEAVKLFTKKLAVEDYRSEKDPAGVLIRLQALPGTLTWVEGDDKERMGGKNRTELTRADHLVIWTIPPSPDELRDVIKAVQPRLVSVIAVEPSHESTENFLSRLLGMLKYVVNKRQGKVTYEELAAATGQRVLTIERGTSWLIARGWFSLEGEENGILTIGTGNSGLDVVKAAMLKSELDKLIAETAAYRDHFRQADKNTLFPEIDYN